jgi:hypothetical protein
MAKSQGKTQDKTGMSDFIQGWLLSEDAAQDIVAVKRIYVDICDRNLHSGVMLSQIMFWHGKSKETGKPRLQIFREGHYWLAKSYQDWWDECRVNEHTARKCIAHLEKLGLIETRLWKFAGTPTKHIRIVWNALELAIRYEGSDGNDTEGQIGSTPKVNSICDEGSDPIQRLPSKTTTKKTTETTNIDSVSGESADINESNFCTDFTKDGSNARSGKPSGTASDQNQIQDSGARENDNHSQNETITPPKKKWNPSIPIGFDSSGYIKLPPLKDVDPKHKATYSAVWPKVYRETQFKVAEEWIDDITIEEDEDGEVLICDKDGDWTEQEAFGQGGCLPLRKLRDIAAADPDSGFSVDEYNEFIIDRFNYHWNRR